MNLRPLPPLCPVRPRTITSAAIVAALAWGAAFGLPRPAAAQLLEKLPAELEGVGIDDKSGDQVPLDLRFRDESGAWITLSDVFTGERPVLLSLNYSDCPMLCGIQLNALVRTLREVSLSAGEGYDLVSVSINPLEQPARAKQTEQKYLADYTRGGEGGGERNKLAAARGFRFLVGPKESVTRLAEAVGFRYRFVPDTGEYAHNPAAIVVSPGGKLCRYLYGVQYDPQTLRLSLVEASEGKVGSPLDQILLSCFHYDEKKGRYGPVARNIMSAGAALTILCLALGLAPYWFRRAGAGVDPASLPAAPATNQPASPPPSGAQPRDPR